jgi:circadian clock protein KaiC
MTVERISTGISGLDALIEGGFPKGFTILVAGNPGTGKTVLTAHYLYNGLVNNQNGLYVSFSEADYSFYNNTERFGMKFREFQKQNRFSFLDFSAVTQEGIQDALEEVLATIKETNAERIVIDSFSAIFQAFVNPNEARIALHVVLGKMLRAQGVTTLVIGEVPIGSVSIGSGIEEFVADGIIKMEHGNTNASPIIVKVIKMRSTSIDREPHICVIKNDGMTIFPKQSIKLNPNSQYKRVETGIKGLDERIGGGFLEGTTSIIIGASGLGKTTFALEFIIHGIINGERCLYCTVEETYDELKRCPGISNYNLDSWKEKELFIMSTLIENQSIDEFLDTLDKKIADIRPKRIVIDSLTSLEHTCKNEIYMIIKRLVSLLHKYSLTAIITIGTAPSSSLNSVDLSISSLFHNIVLLRYIEAKSKVKRSITILKMRGSYHDNSILEFILSNDGLNIVGTMNVSGDTLSDFSPDSNKLHNEIKDEISIQQKEKRNKRRPEFERYEAETLNKEPMERKKRKEEIKKNLGIDNNDVNKNDDNQKKE